MPSVSREAIYAALFTKVSTAAKFTTKSRRLKHFAQVQPGEHPAIYQIQRDEMGQAVRGIPTKWTLSVDLFIYAWQADLKAAPSQALNPLLDAIEAAFKPDTPTVNDCTLGGLVSRCGIAGKVEIFEGVGDGNQAVAIVPIDIVIA